MKEDSPEEEEEDQEFIQNRTRAGRDSRRGRTNTLPRNAGFDELANAPDLPMLAVNSSLPFAPLLDLV